MVVPSKLELSDSWHPSRDLHTKQKFIIIIIIIYFFHVGKMTLSDNRIARAHSRVCPPMCKVQHVLFRLAWWAKGLEELRFEDHVARRAGHDAPADALEVRSQPIPTYAAVALHKLLK